MIINGFGGGVAEALGLKVVQVGTTLYNNGVFASGLSIGPGVTQINTLPSGVTGYTAPFLRAKGGGVFALIAEPIYLVPLRGKKFYVDVYNQSSGTNPYHGMSVCIGITTLPSQWSNSVDGTSGNNSRTPQQTLGVSSYFSGTVGATTLSVDITNSMIFGYICAGDGGYGYDYHAYNNIRIAA